MLIAVLVVASLITTVWVVLLFMVTREDWIVAAYNKVLSNLSSIDELRQKEVQKHEQLAKYDGFAAVVMKLLHGGHAGKDIAKLEQQNEMLQGGSLKSVSLFDLPGYVLLRRFSALSHGSLHKAILTTSFELYGRKHAEMKAKQLLARILSYPLVGVAVVLVLGAIVLGFGNTTMGFAIIGIGTVLVLMLVYAMYDDVHDKANKRREAIARQFPNMVSKLALLVTSGMIMDRAWKETAYSQSFELYREMQKTSEELDNLVSPEAAYGAFINRCNTKETAKLASAIMQNLSKGNAEIGRLLKDIAKEVWLERRHSAKRNSEKANSKLMIPTMLLFVAILIMIMVPVAMSFSGF